MLTNIRTILAANEEAVKIEELKSVILAERTVKVVNEAGELMEAAVSNAQKNRNVSKEEVAAATAQLAQVARGRASDDALECRARRDGPAAISMS